MNNVVKQYLKECRRTFPFISKNEKLFFKRLEDNLNDIDENVTYKEICLKYGEPKNVMISYIENCDNEYILKRTSIKSIVKKIFITLTSGSDKNKFFKDKLIITVTSAGMLEIEDRRDSAFLWVFEVLLDNAIRIGNAFEFDNAISTLKSDISLDAWTYKYYDCHEEVTCKSIQDVFSTILKRQH